MMALAPKTMTSPGKTPSENREALAGTVERVTFHNPESGFCVLQVRVRGRREPASVIGVVAVVSAGEQVQASGEWETTVAHGVQFRAAHLVTTEPTSVEGIERYLGSGLIRGIGRELASRLVKAFGERVFDVIDHHPERLRTVDGIGPKRLENILEGWREQRAVRDIMVFLQENGVGTSRSARIYRTYGADAVPLIQENPYRLARDIRGIGFRIADEIARRLGVEKDSPERARAGITYTLAQARKQGHCCLPREELLRQAEELLEIRREVLEPALMQEMAEGILVDDEIDGESHLFLKLLWEAEKKIAERLTALAGGEPPWSTIDPGSAVPWVEKEAGVDLSASQRAAVETALASKVLVITGGPGVGKTTLVNAILSILRARRVRVSLCAPTGRAAKRLMESTGLEARTIHRLLEVDPRMGRFKRDADAPLECDLLVVDETSMVDVPLMAALLDALPADRGLLLVGDVDQLPSVGPGQVLRDVIDSGIVPVARLTEIFRQAESSRIVTSAHRINRGLMPELRSPDRDQTSDFYFVAASDVQDAQRKVAEIVARRIPRRFGLDPVRDVQVLSPMNRGPLGAGTLNVVLQEELNPGTAGPTVERFGYRYRVGDKVMQIENDYDRDVFNGDLGVVVSIDPDAQEVGVRFDGRAVTYAFSELDQLVLAYATTIHKAQGSEYPGVVIPLTMQHYPMLRANLVYTGVTRGRELVVIVGEERALAKALREGEDRRRCSKLLSRLRDGL